MSVRRVIVAVTSTALTSALYLATPVSASAATKARTGAPGTSFVVSQAQFDKMFPGRNSFYTYKGLTDALGAYPAFAHSGNDAIRKREAAAFLANVSHETGGLRYIVEQDTRNYSHYCDASQPYGCPARGSGHYRS